jgi:anti-anti-sigma factor
MRFEGKPRSDAMVLRLEGEFDAFNLADLRGAIDGLLAAGHLKVVANLEGLTFLNSTALNYLIRVKQRLSDAGGDLFLVHPTPFVNKTLGALGLLTYFKLFDSDDEAILHFGGTTRRPAKVAVADPVPGPLTIYTEA